MISDAYSDPEGFVPIQFPGGAHSPFYSPIRTSPEDFTPLQFPDGYYLPKPDEIVPKQLELDLGIPPMSENLVLSANNQEFKRDLEQVLNDIKELLLAKNESYGDAALNPVRIFSKASATEQLKVRLDDKLSRLARGREDLIIEDVLLDFTGYLVLYKIAELRANRIGNS